MYTSASNHRKIIGALVLFAVCSFGLVQVCLAQASTLPFSPARWSGALLYLSGQGSRDPKTGRIPENFSAQARQSLENCRALLKKEGLDLTHVVKANVYLTDIKNFAEMNGVYKTFFAKDPPARTTVALPALPGGMQIEITLVASKNQHRKPIYPDGQKPTPNDLYSPAIQSGEMIFLSGQGSRQYLTKEFPTGGFEGHVRQCLENLGQVLKAAGLGFEDVVRSDVYLTDIKTIGDMNKVYKTFFQTNPPVRTTVAVTALPGEPPIEITLLATRSKSKKVVAPPNAPSGMPFSPGIQLGDQLYLAGKAGFSKEGFEAQLKEVLDGCLETLKAGGMDFSNVLEGKVYLANMQDYEKLNAIYRTYFQGVFPARTCVAISNLVAGSQIEITLLARKK
jgi:reactive intermediate/imine deaminase